MVKRKSQREMGRAIIKRPQFPIHRPDTKSPSKTVPRTGRFDSRTSENGSSSSRSGKLDDRQVGGLADFQAAGCGFSAKGPGAEERGHGEQQRT